MHGKIGLEGLIKGELASIFLENGSEVAAISEDSVKEFQTKAPGHVQLTRPFLENARDRTAFGQERDVTTQTVPPGEWDSVILGQEKLR